MEIPADMKFWKFSWPGSPPLCELLLKGATADEIPGESGCKSKVTVFAIDKWCYVDNVLIGTDKGPLFSENLSLYEIAMNIITASSKEV